jgi:hypothetical protein
MSLFLALLAVALLGPGCNKKGEGDPATNSRNAELGEIHEMYMMYVKQNQKPPQQLADLQGAQAAIYPRGSQALKDGRYLPVWGVSSKDSHTVLAYEKDAPTQGGTVLMADGSVKTMTAAELQAAVKGKG